MSAFKQIKKLESLLSDSMITSVIPKPGEELLQSYTRVVQANTQLSNNADKALKILIQIKEDFQEFKTEFDKVKVELRKKQYENF